MPSSKKNRSSHEQKRPLTAYNLYYRFKRTKIIEASTNNSNIDKETVIRLVQTTPGLENYPSTMKNKIPPNQLDGIRQRMIRLAMEQQLGAKDTKKRQHKKSGNGFKLGFLEMNRIMVATWKAMDDFTKVIFTELAEEGRLEHQRRLMESHNGTQASSDNKPSPSFQEVAVGSFSLCNNDHVRASSAHSSSSSGRADVTPEPTKAILNMVMVYKSQKDYLVNTKSQGNAVESSMMYKRDKVKERIANTFPASFKLAQTNSSAARIPQRPFEQSFRTTGQAQGQFLLPLDHGQRTICKSMSQAVPSEGSHQEVATTKDFVAEVKPEVPKKSDSDYLSHPEDMHQRNVSVNDFMELIDTLRQD